ncbi:hypothetical protein NBRC110019_14670 [Neptunitalea chrysea]|uniref:Thioredoxin-like fold domain-containing protein n=1 Tax=Neptunitalea chrysea TaxID=1647581 RepID=A0A9W6B5W3_9FLAO|nr:thioredoxin-like domain-containing protein [Neptunitalea chrysea]GLB52427.1 hypothetical protein NBRC110019_14670 [Neptunitalea chrysea]
MKKIIYIIFIITIVSCGDDNDAVTYFGGQIVNPKSDIVVLYKNDIAVDTVFLDDHNKFMFEFEDLKSGLYKFESEPEYQHFILEKGDSLLLRLNTMDFDESLVFSGKGAKKNNFFIDQFLKEEDDEKLIKGDFLKYPAHIFKEKIDSLHNQRVANLNEFEKHNHISEYSKKLLHSNIDFNLYRYMEIYPLLYNNMYDKKLNLSDLDNNFYSYRKEINVNQEDLNDFTPLTRYLRFYSAGEAYKNVVKDHPEFSHDSIVSTIEYQIEKLKVLGNEIQEINTHDNTMRNAAYIYFFNDKRDLSKDDVYINSFITYNKENKYLPEVKDLYKNIQGLKSGKKLDSITFVCEQGNHLTIKQINKKQLTVYYFWALNQKNHFHNIIKRVHQLNKRFPKVKFVGINRDLDQKTWVATLKKYHLDATCQYRITDFEYTHQKLIINKMNKVLVIDSNGVIIDAFANIYDGNFESILSAAKNKEYIAQSLK